MKGTEMCPKVIAINVDGCSSAKAVYYVEYFLQMISHSGV